MVRTPGNGLKVAVRARLSRRAGRWWRCKIKPLTHKDEPTPHHSVTRLARRIDLLQPRTFPEGGTAPPSPSQRSTA